MFPGFLSKDEKPAVCPLTFIQEEQSRARKRSWGRQEEGAWLRTRTMFRCEHYSCSTAVDSTLIIVWVSEFSLFSLLFKHVWVICCLWLAAENYVKITAYLIVDPSLARFVTQFLLIQHLNRQICVYSLKQLTSKKCEMWSTAFKWKRWKTITH